MDFSKRLVLLKSSAKEGNYPALTPEDVVFLFWKRFYLKRLHIQKVWSLVIQILLGGGSHVIDSKIYLIINCMLYCMLELHDNIC